MKRIRTTASDKRLHRQLTEQHAGCLYDYEVRLGNALYALSRLTPGWIMFLESIDQNLPLEEITRIVETEARALAIRHYNFQGRERRIIFGNYMFGNNGNLILG